MKKSIFILILCNLLASNSAGQSDTVRHTNPVLTLADGCVERFMGYFYATGQGARGGIYPSKDLVSWATPTLGITTDEVQWLTMPQYQSLPGIGTYKGVMAGDILYRNGVFHAYWNGIGHAYAPAPLGPYKENSVNEPFDDYGIDVQVFQDEDGEIYYVKKRNAVDPHPVTGDKSNIDGPEIWILKMNSPFVRKGIPATDAGVQLTHQRGHPTSINHVNFEGPELAKYRDRYYLFFASNRMGPRSGLYQIGVAESDAPMNFTNEKKYPHAVHTRNTEQHLLEYKTILHTAEHGGWSAKHVTQKPAAGWMNLDFDDAAWNSSTGGYGRQEYDLYARTTHTNARIRARKTEWTASNIYIRRKFTLENIPENAGLKYWVNGNADFYINGNKINVNARNETYCNMEINTSFLVKGENIIAVEVAAPCSDQYCQQFIDFGLYDTGGKKIENVALGQAQPNFVIGPNGFERWMMYKAYFNSPQQQQGIDRIHFYDKEVVVESSVVKNTTGYHPKPSMPTFSDYFDLMLPYAYEYLNNSEWDMTDGMLKPKNAAVSELLFRADPMTNYRYEIPFRIESSKGDYMGAYAYYVDPDNWLKIKINRDDAAWEYEINRNGVLTKQFQNLPAKFKFLDDHPLVAHYDEPWHTLTIYKNGANFKVELDYFNLTLNGLIHTDFTGSGKIGLIGSSNNVNFDAVQYTNGWDEWDDNITGWETKGGAWTVNENGMQQTQSFGKAITLKGDKNYDYEFSVFMKNDKIPTGGKAGFYPLYIDENNYVQAGIDYPTGKLEIIKKENGGEETQYFDLSNNTYRQYTFHSYPTTSYQYDFRCETDVSGVNILWFEGNYPYLNQTFDLPTDVKFYALQGNAWIPLSHQLDGELRFSYFNRFTFDKVRTKAIRMDVTPKAGMACRAFAAYFSEDLASSYFLRARRENDKLYLFVNDSLKTILDGDWAPSNVGLYTESCTAGFNGILHYQTGKVAVTKINIPPLSCAVGESIQLIAEVEPANATNKLLVWESSDPAIAGIDHTGKLTRHAWGNVSVSARTADGGTVKETVTLEENTGMDMPESSNFLYYPNPVRDRLTINPGGQMATVSLFSLSGNALINRIVNGNSEKIDVSALSAGIYILNIFNNDLKVSGKIIKN
ncbi:MAG: family 43 glycosylhydrolase [Tannerella sp.]|nr:family 43 glycosylhydrolase [Tannerella sp.]